MYQIILLFNIVISHFGPVIYLFQLYTPYMSNNNDFALPIIVRAMKTGR